MKIEKNFYGKLKDGRDVHSFTVTNDNGAYIELVDYGATLNKIVVPDKNGNMLDVLVGFDTVEGQELCTDSQGRTVGRVANRIAGKGITIDGKNYQITKNVDGKFTLHSNHEYETVVWSSEIVGDNCVKFTFTDDNEVIIDYNCVPTEKCPLNITNHAYFNLKGFDGGQIVDHEVQFFCDAYTPTDNDAIPTGEIRDVTGTAFDFRTPKTIEKDVDEKDEQLIIGRGYDHNFAISGYDGTLKKFAVVKSDKSGIVLEAYTDLPGSQFYIGNYMNGTQIGKAGKPIEYRTGFCLETQYFPDAANHKEFISNIFSPEKPFVSRTIFKFSK